MALTDILLIHRIIRAKPVILEILKIIELLMFNVTLFIMLEKMFSLKYQHAGAE